MTVLHQAIPVLEPADAASNHTLEVQALLHSMGVESEIYADRVHPSLAKRARPADDIADGPVLYQFAIGSTLADRFAARRDRFAINFHNLTPPQFFDGWDTGLVHGTRWGLAQLDRLAPRCAFAVAVSMFNESELVAHGYRHTAVAPLLVDVGRFDGVVDEPTHTRLAGLRRAGGTDWLFVGRIVPNKAQHDLVKAFAVYRRHVDGRARLWLVGGASVELYERALRKFVAELGLADVVTFTGALSAAALAAHYAAADVFVTLSRHEGFCAPVLEAFHHGLPVVAVAEAALPETLDGAGVLVPDRAPETVATAVERVLTDTVLRSALVAAGHRRLAGLSLPLTRARMGAVLAGFLREQA